MALFHKGAEEKESDELVFARGEASDISSRIKTEYPEAKGIWGEALTRFEKILLEGGSEAEQIVSSRALIEVYKKLGQMRGMFDERLAALNVKIGLAEADIKNPYLGSRTVMAIGNCRSDFNRIEADIKTAPIGGAMWNELNSRLSKLEDFWIKVQRTAIDFDLRHGPENQKTAEEDILGRMKDCIAQAARKIGDAKRAESLLGQAWSYYRDAENGWKSKAINKGDILQDEAGMKNAIKKVVA